MINVYRNRATHSLWAVDGNSRVFYWCRVGIAWLYMPDQSHKLVRRHCQLIASNVKFK